MPTKLKLRHAQTHVATDVIQERLDLCRWYLSLTRTMHELTFPLDKAGFGSSMELMLVFIGVFIGDAEGRPTTATKIAVHCGMARASVYRRLKQLMAMGKVTRERRNYYIAPGAAPIDERGLLPTVLDKFPANRRSKRTL